MFKQQAISRQDANIIIKTAHPTELNAFCTHTIIHIHILETMRLQVKLSSSCCPMHLA